MEEMTKTIIFLLIISGLIASIVEVVKKLISVKQKVGGKERIKTKLSRGVIIVLSTMFSILFVLIAYSGGVLIGRWPMIFLYIAIVFVAQWFIDMQVVKRIAEKIIDKMLNRF